jgi:hypothetical protein
MPELHSSGKPECCTCAANTGCGSMDETIYLQLVAGPQNNFTSIAGI